MVDRLTLDDEGAAHEEFSLADFPEEELLRLDDGTPLPAALTELRSLLNLHAAAAAEPVVQSDDDPEAAARLAAIAASKADMLRDCLLDFDEGLLLITAGIKETVRLLPPLCITKDEVAMALDKLEKAMNMVFPNRVGS